MDLGCNKNVIYTKPITLTKRHLQCCRCHGPYVFDKTSKLFLYLTPVPVPKNGTRTPLPGSSTTEET